MNLRLKSNAFVNGALIPKQYTCDGADISPSLSWEGVPLESKSLALLCDDPDAPMGTWVHWIIYNLPPTVTSLKEKQPQTIVLPNGGNQGENDFGKIGYRGPCPPGGIHRYYFKLYALNTILHLESAVTKKKLLEAMEGHILATAELMGRYSRH